MSETNFTEQDRRWLERLEVPTGPSNSRTKEAITRAIAEIDSLRREMESFRILLGADQGADLDEPLGRLLGENDSLRAQLGEAQAKYKRVKQEREDWKQAARLDCEIVQQRQGVIDTLRSENERLKEQLEDARLGWRQALDADCKLREALRLIQWVGSLMPFARCPRCEQPQVRGHAPDCEVGAALAGETKEPCSVCGRPTGGCCTVRKPDPLEITRGQQADPEQPEWATDAVTTRLQLSAYVEMFNNLTLEEARAALKRMEAQSETGSAAKRPITASEVARLIEEADVTVSELITDPAAIIAVTKRLLAEHLRKTGGAA